MNAFMDFFFHLLCVNKNPSLKWGKIGGGRGFRKMQTAITYSRPGISLQVHFLSESHFSPVLVIISFKNVCLFLFSYFVHSLNFFCWRNLWYMAGTFETGVGVFSLSPVTWIIERSSMLLILLEMCERKLEHEKGALSPVFKDANA